MFKRRSLPPTPVTPHEYLALSLEISYARQSLANAEEVEGKHTYIVLNFIKMEEMFSALTASCFLIPTVIMFKYLFLKLSNG